MPIENIEVDEYDPLSPAVSVIAYTGGEETGAVSLGAGQKVFKRKDGSTFEFRTLQAGDGVSIIEGEETLLFKFDAADLDLDELEFGSTDNLAEGQNNLYYTDERVRDAISIASDSNPALVYRPSSGEISLVGDIYTKSDFDTDFATKDTADLPEATTATPTNGQMYFTQGRARQALSATGDLTYNSASGEFNVNTYKTANFNVDFGAKTTDDLTQGTTNLYYSDTRVQGYLNSQSYLSQGSADVRYIQQSHPVNGITSQDITDWNSLVSQQVIVSWADITSKPAWVVGTSASSGDILVWSGAEWTPTDLQIPTDLSDLTDTTDLLDTSDTDWTEIQNIPTTFAPSAHSHIINEVIGLQAELDSKAELNHTHTGLAISATTGLQAALDGRALISHTHAIADVSGLQQELDMKIEDETLTSLSLNANILTYTDENGGDTNIDLSVYIDDTNLARITAGVYDSNTQLMTFTRDDNTSFTMNVAALSQITSLQELTDTVISGTQADGTVLTWNSAAAKWLPDTPSYFSGDWDDLTNKPTTFAAEAHTHTIAEVDTLQAALDAKSAVGHTHTLADVSNGVDTLDTLLDDKSDVIHAHIAADITDFVSAVQDVVIDGGTY